MANSSEKLITIKVKLAGQLFCGIVDTGSVRSLIKESQRYKTGVPSSVTNGICIRFGDGAIETLNQQLAIETEFENLKQTHNYLIAKNLPVPLLLGLDFLRKFGVTLKLSPKSIEIESPNEFACLLANELPLFENDDSPRSVSLPLAVTLPPYHGIIMTVCCEDSLYEQAFFEPSAQLSEKYGILLEPALVEIINNEFRININNYASQELFLPRNLCIGHINHNDTDCLFSDLSDKRTTKEEHILTANINKCLNDDQRQRMLELLRNHCHLFAQDVKDLKGCKYAEHSIILTGEHHPINQRPNRLPGAYREDVQAQITEMLEHGVIRPSTSPWASPLVCVKKSNGKLRLCVDYRKLNTITIKDSFPLPKIDQILDSMSNSAYFTTLDLHSGYWQLPMRNSDISKTAFVSDFGLFEFTRMPFGLTSAPASFQRLMMTVLAGLLYNSCMVYLDDVAIFAKNFDDHLRAIDEVFRRLDDADLRMKLEKCYFAEKEVKLLGFRVSVDGISTDEDKIIAVRNFSVPTCVKDVQSFLGLCGYYRSFVQSFAKIGQPMFQLLKKDQDFNWTDDCQIAFDQLKQKLTESPCLTFFDESLPIRVSTDASGQGLGVTLAVVKNKKEQPCGYYSRSLNKHEKNYTISELECLAFIFALRKLRHYLLGRKFTLVTDHCALCYLKTIKDPTSRLCRWSVLVSEFDFDIMYKKGRLHKNADCLSRFPCEPPIADHEEEGPLPAFNSFLIDEFENLRKEQLDDTYCQSVMAQLEAEGVNQFKVDFEVINGLLYKKQTTEFAELQLIVLPISLFIKVMNFLHDSIEVGHMGFSRTYDRVKHRYFRPGLSKLVARYIRTCVDCQKRKAIRRRAVGFLQSPDFPLDPFESLAIDVCGPMIETPRGNRYIVAIIDRATRFVTAKAYPQVTAAIIANFLYEEIVTKEGVPKVISSDRGSVFVSDLVEELLRLMKIRHFRTSSYRPQANGLIERVFGTLKEVLAIYVRSVHCSWDEYLSAAVFELNTSHHTF